METVTGTVSNVVTAASKAIWGDSTQNTEGNETLGSEPVSGSTGNVQAGEPYDKGNEDTGVASATTTTNIHGNRTDQYGNAIGADSTGTTSNTDTLLDPSTGTTNKHGNHTDQYGNAIGAGAGTGTTGTSPNTSILPDRSTTGALATATDAGNTTETTTRNTADDTSSSNPTTGLADNNPSTSIPAPSKDNTTSPNAPPTANNDAPSDAQPAQPPPETSSAAKGTDTEDAGKEGATKDIVPGIHETKKAGDHAPKFDTFETKTGPHIDDPKVDGRVGPDIPKGEINDELLKDDGKDESHSSHDKLKEAESVHHTDHAGESGATHEGEEKEKLSLKDKIKAKLHKH